MARKHFSAVPAKKKPRIARLASAKPPLCAHQCLVHGFLVRLPRKSPIVGAAAKVARADAEAASARALRPAGTKHEGPADDATFH